MDRVKGNWRIDILVDGFRHTNHVYGVTFETAYASAKRQIENDDNASFTITFVKEV